MVEGGTNSLQRGSMYLSWDGEDCQSQAGEAGEKPREAAEEGQSGGRKEEGMGKNIFRGRFKRPRREGWLDTGHRQLPVLLRRDCARYHTHNVLSIPLETGHSRRGKSDSHLYAGHVKTPHSSVDVKSIETANMGPSSGLPTPHHAHLQDPREVAPGSFRNVGGGGVGGAGWGSPSLPPREYLGSFSMWDWDPEPAEFSVWKWESGKGSKKLTPPRFRSIFFSF